MRTWIALGLALLVSVPAVAMAGQEDGGAHHEHAKFPLAADVFKAKVDARTARARAEMEREVAALPADKAKERRAEFERGVVRVNQEVATVTADGKVTKEEAREVRKVAREAKIGRGHGRHAH